MGDAGVDGRVNFLKSSLKENIGRFRRGRLYNRHWAFGLKIGSAALSALVTVLIGLHSNPLIRGVENLISLCALIGSAILTVISAWEAFFDHRWLWIRYTETINILYSISDDLEYALSSGQTPTDECLNALYKRLQSALQDTNQAWGQKRAQDSAAASKAI